MQTQDARAEKSGLNTTLSAKMLMHERSMQGQHSNDDRSTPQTVQDSPLPMPMPMPIIHDMKALEAATALLLSKPRSHARQEQLVFCQREWKLRLAKVSDSGFHCANCTHALHRLSGKPTLPWRLAGSPQRRRSAEFGRGICRWSCA